ncbi:MAG TPA: RNA polymerase sigma-70 factor [Bacteroidales bacterium]|nr:RNA polymerase sigma-70 factor [Bacteroidales bacterium]
MSLSDKELAVALHGGNETIFEQVFRDYYERLCNYANTMVNDMDEAEEIVQSTFLALWEKRSGIDIHTSVKSYLYQAVHNTCLNRIKHNRVKQTHSEYYRYTADVAMGSGSDLLIGKELEGQINDAIDSLPSQCQTVFRLSRFENLTYAEISEQLNISVKTVENHMGKALRILREKLKDYLPLFLFILFYFLKTTND